MTKESKSLLDYSYIRNFFRDFFLSMKIVCDNLESVDYLVRDIFLNKNIANVSSKGQSDYSLKFLEADYHDKIGIGISTFLNDFNKLKQSFFLHLVE